MSWLPSQIKPVNTPLSEHKQTHRFHTETLEINYSLITDFDSIELGMTFMKLVLALVGVLFLTACTNAIMVKRSDGSVFSAKKNAVIVGYLSEGYITQPHGLRLLIQSPKPILDDKKISVFMNTKGNEDESPRNSILGHRFMYEVPPGEYEVRVWDYQHYRGMSLPRTEKLLFNLSAGEVAYLGNFHGIALGFCLSNSDEFESEVEKIKKKYPVLSDYEIINKSKVIAFSRWGHEKSTPVLGIDACK